MFSREQENIVLEWWCCACAFEGMSDQHPNDETGIFCCWHNHRCDYGTNGHQKKQSYEIIRWKLVLCMYFQRESREK